jgi:hypothetical protein
MKAKPTPTVIPSRIAITGIRALKKLDAIPNILAKKVVILIDIYSHLLSVRLFALLPSK